MPLDQCKFTLVPDRPGHIGTASPPPELRRPMTTKQARKAFLERTRGPRLSRAEQRERERRLQEEIRRDLREKERREKEDKEKERQQRKAKILREKKKAREDAEREAKRKAGVPIAPPRPSQPTLAGFFNGNATVKRRARDEEDAQHEEVAICKEAEGEDKDKDTLPVSPSAVTRTPVRNRVRIESLPTERRPSPQPPSPIMISDTREATSVDNCTPSGNCTPPATPKPSPVPGVKSLEKLSPKHISPKHTSPKAFPLKKSPPKEFPPKQKQPISLRSRSPPRKKSRLSPILEDSEASGPVIDEDARHRPPAVVDLADIEDLFPSGTQLQRELLANEDDSGFSEPEAPVVKPNLDNPVKISVPIYQHPEDAKPSTRAPRPTVIEAVSIEMMPFFCTQDCVLSAQDLEEIETPTRTRPTMKPRPSPRVPLSCSDVFLERPQHANRIPPRNQSAYLQSAAKHATKPPGLIKPLVSTVMGNRKPPARLPPRQPVSPPLPSSVTKPETSTKRRTTMPIETSRTPCSPLLPAEDLRAMQEASWDDDENLENRGPQHSLARESPQLPSQSTKRGQADPLGDDIRDNCVSSQDMRALFSENWDDDLV
ncbi:hypothetical protein SODALDRAFT_333889 [Sodiomyces alkalinus F11]|uniref:Uncharacterized protein n=1 Tax=Sodiomyces alkalinus (strain CBS 110278 / VKM F-3762 / F11) TaxID=1314773 RepID=A0A3N2PUU0_SODAK|nr:hypothetical protein SODALDRAFT_333889 [Sodiomyces alkalinus F11]ROT38116.1 hypothetical protein SODALDRAFT_333889 [Sodiomyces alkalinus F11]